LALDAFNLRKNDEVILPTHTFTATAEVVDYFDAKIVFSDVESDSLNISLEKIKPLISKNTKILMPVHFGGLPVNMEKIYEICSERSINIVEDAAHAFPSKYNNKLIGSNVNSITVFSFYANKTITTGEGGMVVLHNQELAKDISIMRSHGIDRDVFMRYTSTKPSWYYEVINSGFKYNMTDLAASIGIHQLNKAFQFQKKRELIANEYYKLLKNTCLKLPRFASKSSKHAWHLFVVRLPEELIKNRDFIIQKLASNGISTSVHYIPLHRHPYWKRKYDLKIENFPNSDKAYLSSISLPIHCKMDLEDVHYVCENLLKLL